MHFLLSLCYTEPAGCMEPTNVLIRVCILLLMQPAPLAGTATCLNWYARWTSADAARTPRGDGNGAAMPNTEIRFLDATRTPRGDGNFSHCQPSCSTLRLRCNPHPSRGRQLQNAHSTISRKRMQPAPLTGTATEWCSCRTSCSSDVAHAPYGDSNRFAQDTTHYSIA